MINESRGLVKALEGDERHGCAHDEVSAVGSG
jgi:hypothetical protein